MRPNDFAPIVAAYRAEVLRWNRQINLISRQDTAATLDGLLAQCARAADVLLGACPELGTGPVLYCDLGSGGGLPGVLWHAHLQGAGAGLTTYMVEPREKRAWFLRRVAPLAGAPAYRVLEGRWGEVAADRADDAAIALISLKALRLTDPEILAGLAAVRPAAAIPLRQIVIARFHPVDEVLTPALSRELAIAGPGRRLGAWTGAGAEILPVVGHAGPEAALVVCRYVPAGA